MWLIDTVYERAIGYLAVLDPTRREIILATLFLVAITGIGTGGYVIVEGWNAVDAFYMTFITLTTIGYTEVHPLSQAGRFFTIFVALFGIGAVAFIATRSAQLLLTNQRIRERHLRQTIERLKDHYILCGYGRIGKRIAQVHEKSFIVVDRVEEGAPIAGRSLAESHFRQQFDAIVIAIIEGATDEMRFNPSAQHVIHAGDVLVVLGSEEMIERLREEGCRGTAAGRNRVSGSRNS